MNLLEYVQKYSNSSFEEKGFNNVESAILSLLVYARFEDVFANFEDNNKILSFNELTDEDIDVLSAPKTFGKENGDLLKAMRHTNRYKDVTVQQCSHISDNEALEQFLAITYHIPFVGYYICFRGTDGTLIGWRENLSVLYHEATLAQLDAIEYLYQFINQHPNESFMIGGHSKGGNLAMYSLFFSPEEIYKKITTVYSFDGYGFINKKYKNTPCYDERLAHLIQIVPHDSIVGEMFYTPANPIVIDAFGKGIIQHHPMHWILSDNGELCTIERRSFKSRLIHRTVKKWSQKASKRNYKIFVTMAIAAFEGENGKFEFYDEDSGIYFSKILKKFKPFSFREKLSFIGLFLLLIGTLISSCFYYIFGLHKLRKNKK